MKKYFIKTPWWLKKIYASYTWSVPQDQKVLYFTFDDGPHPEATPFVLDTLKEYNAKATFFCIGKNVLAEPALYQRILQEGHAVGNHTQHHLNGWKTNDGDYLQDVKEATAYINSNLFRPPYGRIRARQAQQIGNLLGGGRIIMWDVLSADFDETLSGQDCLNNVIRKAGKGSIIVFHDSQKAFERLKISLPEALNFFQKKGFLFKSLENSEMGINK